jgi:hypothetical protein
MTQPYEHHRGPERRRLPRGGRRVGDAAGFAPLVMVVGQGEAVIAQSEAVLARLKFAVTTSGSVDEALRVMASIRPDVVVAEPDAAMRIRLESSEPVPVVELNGDMRGNPDALVEGIREAIRASQNQVR